MNLGSGSGDNATSLSFLAPSYNPPGSLYVR